MARRPRNTGAKPKGSRQLVGLRPFVALVATAVALVAVYLIVVSRGGDDSSGIQGAGSSGSSQAWSDQDVRRLAALSGIDQLMARHAQPLLVPRPVGSRNHAAARQVGGCVCVYVYVGVAAMSRPWFC